MAESMKDFERELEASFKRIDEGDIISGTVCWGGVDGRGLFLTLSFMLRVLFRWRSFPGCRGLLLKRLFSRGMRFRSMVLRRDEGQGNILLSRADAADVLAGTG